MNNKSSSLASLREKILANQADTDNSEKKELPPLAAKDKADAPKPAPQRSSSLASLKPTGLPAREKTEEKKPLPSLKSSGGLSQKFPPKESATKPEFQTLDIPKKLPSIKNGNKQERNIEQENLVNDILSSKPEQIPAEEMQATQVEKKEEANDASSTTLVETKAAPDNTFLQKLMASAQSQQEKDTSFFQKVNTLNKKDLPNIPDKIEEIEDNHPQVQNVSINKKQMEEVESLKRKVHMLQDELDALRIKYNKILSVRYRNTLVLNPNTNDLSEGFLDIIKKASSTQLYDEFNHLQAEILELKYQHQEKKENEVFLRKQIRELQAMLGEREVAIANLRVQFVEITQKYTSATEHYKKLNEKNINQIQHLNEEVHALKENIKHIYDYSGKFYDRLFKDFHQRLDMEIYRYDEIIQNLEKNIQKQKEMYQDDLSEYVQNEKKWIRILQEKEEEIRDLERRLRGKYEYSLQKISRGASHLPSREVPEYRREEKPESTALSPRQKEAQVEHQIDFSKTKRNLDQRIKQLYSMETQLKEKQTEIHSHLNKNYDDLVSAKDQDRKYIMSEYDKRLTHLKEVDTNLKDFDHQIDTGLKSYGKDIDQFKDQFYNRQLIVSLARKALVNADPDAAQKLQLEDMDRSKLMQLISLKKMIESRFTNREQLLRIKIQNVREEKERLQAEIAKTQKNIDRLQSSFKRERNYTTVKQEEYESELNAFQVTLHELRQKLDKVTVEDEMRLKTQYLNLTNEKEREEQNFDNLEKEFFKGLTNKYEKGN